MRIGIGDRASRRQREIQIVGFEMGRDRNRRRADIDRLSGLDRDTNTAREVVPELHDPRMRPTPLLDVGLDLEVGTLVDDLLAPGSDRAAKAGGEIADLAGLAIDFGDGVELLTQHLAGRDPVGLDTLVPGPVEFPIGVELPGLVREPGQHTAFDRAVVEHQELVPGSGAYRTARQAADQGERIAVSRQTGAIAGAHQLDRFERHAEVVTIEVL